MEAKGFSKRAQMIMSHPAANQRVHQRTPSHQVISVLVDGRTFPAYLRDISDNGAFLFTAADAVDGMRLTLQLPRPGSNERTVIESEVVRIEPSPYAELKGIALKFWRRDLVVGKS